MRIRCDAFDGIGPRPVGSRNAGNVLTMHVAIAVVDDVVVAVGVVVAIRNLVRIKFAVSELLCFSFNGIF